MVKVATLCVNNNINIMSFHELKEDYSSSFLANHEAGVVSNMWNICCELRDNVFIWLLSQTLSYLSLASATTASVSPENEADSTTNQKQLT